MPGDVQGERAARCIVWHDRRGALSPALLGALARPGLEVVRADNVYAALAEACLVAGGPGGGGAGVLLVAEPVEAGQAASLLEMLERYAPRVRVWVHDPARQPSLRSADEADRRRWRAVAQPPMPAGPRAATAELKPAPARPVTPAAASARPKLRLAGVAEREPGEGGERTTERGVSPGGGVGVGEVTGATPARPAEPASLSELLSADELAMLLADEPPKGARTRE